jgi:hypothetical protein
MTDRRRALLTAALGFVQLREGPPEVAPLRRYLDTWSGVGDIIVGLNVDIEMRQFPVAGG